MAESDFAALRNTTDSRYVCTFIDPEGKTSAIEIEILGSNAKLRRGAFILRGNWEFMQDDGHRSMSWSLSAPREEFGRRMVELARTISQPGRVVRIQWPAGAITGRADQMESTPIPGNVDDEKDCFFRNGRFELSASPIGHGTNFDADLEAAGYQRICTFGRELGFEMRISQSGYRYLIEFEHENSTIEIIWIDSFADYMEFMRQFGHLGTLAEASATRYYVEDAHARLGSQRLA
jgi:hypothetical protein